MNGWRCWGDKWLRVGLLLGGVAMLLWWGYWWATLPRTPEALFRVRCATCHELRTARVCDFSPELRPAIVETMRRAHGADQVIDDQEAELIAHYLSDPALCAGSRQKPEKR